MYKLCVFAGTTEGRRLVELLADAPVEVTACVATEYGEALLTPRDRLTVSHRRLTEEEMEALLVRLKERGETVDRIVVQTVDYPEADQALNKLSKLNNQYVGSGMICNITSSLKKIEAGLRNALEPD